MSFELPESSTLNAVSFALFHSSESAAEGVATVSIVSFETLDRESLTKYPFAIVHQEDVTLPNTLPDNQFITFTFDEPVRLKPGAYGVVFEWKPTTEKRAINFNTASSNDTNWRFRITLDSAGDVTKATARNDAKGKSLFFLLHGTTGS